MKKVVISFIAVLSLVAFTAMVFAAQPAEGKSKPSKEVQTMTTESSATIMGKIMSIDKTKHEIVVKDDEAKTDRVIKAEVKDIEKLKKGELVKVVLVPGTADKAGSIEVIKPGNEKMKEKKKGS